MNITLLIGSCSDVWSAVWRLGSSWDSHSTDTWLTSAFLSYWESVGQSLWGGPACVCVCVSVKGVGWNSCGRDGLREGLDSAWQMDGAAGLSFIPTPPPTPFCRFLYYAFFLCHLMNSNLSSTSLQRQLHFFIGCVFHGMRTSLTFGKVSLPNLSAVLCGLVFFYT